MSEITNTATAEFATQISALPLHNLQLIGVFGTQEERRALLRNPDGTFRTVGVGDRLRQGTVAAIDTDTVILSKGTGTRRLTIPRAPDAETGTPQSRAAA